MATIQELKARRTTAESRYRNTALEYVDAWIELQALDAVLAPHTGEHNGFGSQPTILAHPRAFPDVSEALRDPSGRVAARRDEYVRALAASLARDAEAAEQAAAARQAEQNAEAAARAEEEAQANLTALEAAQRAMAVATEAAAKAEAAAEAAENAALAALEAADAVVAPGNREGSN